MSSYLVLEQALFLRSLNKQDGICVLAAEYSFIPSYYKYVYMDEKYPFISMLQKYTIYLNI